MINQLVIGKSYESRGGEIFTIHGAGLKPFENYPYYDKVKKQSWTYRGVWALGKKSEYDLIREVEKVEEKQELKLEVGKTYKNGGGEEVEITRFEEQFPKDKHPFFGSDEEWYAENGKFLLKSSNNFSDLVEEITTNEEEKMEKVITPEEYLRQFTEITDKMKEITKAKNSDYTADSGDAFANFKVVEDLGVCSVEVGMITRISDKLARLVGLTKNKELQVADESYTDTLLDMANYSIILAIYLRNKK